MRRFLIATAAIALLSACSDRRKDTVAQITSEEAKSLRIEASQLYKDIQEKRTASEYYPIKPALWPPGFKKYKPLRVGIYRDGVALALDGDASTEQGIHITPVAMELTPTPSKVQYEKIQDGVYWYRLGK